MSLSSLYLDAFVAVAKHKSFSAAAKELHVTQSALSQRILNLEDELEVAVFIRDPAGLRLTDIGERLLLYCRSKDQLEMDFMSELKDRGAPGLKGLIRIGGFSTLNRSIVIPILGEFMKEHPGVQFDVHQSELRELPSDLQSGRADFIFLSYPLEKQGVESHLLGEEECVMIQSSGRKSVENVYLDHDEFDSTTHEFFKNQNRKIQPYKRAYFDEIYSILEAVKHGMGRAVVPLHLVRSTKGVEIVSGFKSVRTSVYLVHYAQAYYTALQKAVIELFKQEFGARLKS